MDVVLGVYPRIAQGENHALAEKEKRWNQTRCVNFYTGRSWLTNGEAMNDAYIILRVCATLRTAAGIMEHAIIVDHSDVICRSGCREWRSVR